MPREQGGSTSNNLFYALLSTLPSSSKKKKKKLGNLVTITHREILTLWTLNEHNEPRESGPAACYVQILIQPLSATSICRYHEHKYSEMRRQHRNWRKKKFKKALTHTTQEKDLKNIHLHTGYCKGFALQFQGLSCLSCFYCTSPLFHSIPTSIVVLSKRQSNLVLAVFLFYIPLAQYIHLPSSWWSSDLLQQQLFTACIKTENTKDPISKQKGSENQFFLLIFKFYASRSTL